MITPFSNGAHQTGELDCVQHMLQMCVRGITMTGLFPFSAPYTFYTGTCRYSNPAVGIPTYYGPNPGAVAVTPGQAASVNVRQPALNLRLQ